MSKIIKGIISNSTFVAEIGRKIILFFGVLSVIFFILSFTDLPFLAYHKLGMTHAEITETPEVIVIFGGSGMPSPDGFIKAYYAAKAATEFPNAKLIIALPYSETDSLAQLRIMANELIQKGVDPSRITFEPLGVNTRTQAVNIVSMLQFDHQQLSFLVVTTPEHMYRAVHTLIKAGCYNVAGLPAFEKPVEEAKLRGSKNIKDTPEPNLSFRYNMWSYLNYELLVLREYVAISYYKYKGWL